ncbi:MAG: amidohydrolase family protein [Phycisphaerales bacterium JB041]
MRGFLVMLALFTATAYALCAQPATTGQAPPAWTVVHCGNLLAVPGERLRGPSTLVIHNGVIERVLDGHMPVGQAAPQDVAARFVNLSEMFVLPGLIDCHTHITFEYTRDVHLRRVQESDADAAIAGTVYAERTLRAGFTTIRNVGSIGDSAFALRDAIDRGDIPGPRILCAGRAITPTGGHGDRTNGYREDLFDMPGALEGVADGEANIRQAVRAQVKRGADLIKTTATGGVLSNIGAGVEQQLFDDELRAIVETARLLNKKVAAHAHGTRGINAALRAGVDSIEHGTYLDDESIRLFVETGAFLVPTVHAGKFVELKAQDEGYFPPPVRLKAAAVGPQIQDSLRRAHEGGVRIAFGTDVGVGAHGTNAREFVYMVEAGMSPEACIVAATVNAAELCGLSDTIGTLEVGKAADLIAVDGNPLDDIEELLDVDMVIKGGAVVGGED